MFTQIVEHNGYFYVRRFEFGGWAYADKIDLQSGRSIHWWHLSEYRYHGAFGSLEEIMKVVDEYRGKKKKHQQVEKEAKKAEDAKNKVKVHRTLWFKL